MKRADFSSTAWEDRVLALLAQHPDTVSVTDARKVALERRGGADGLWTVRQEGRLLEIPFMIAVVSPGAREARFEVAELYGAERMPGAGLSASVQLVFVCSPESQSMLTVPAHELRALLARKDYPRSVTQVAGRDARGARLSERVAIPLADLAAVDGATVSHPESW